MRYSYHELDNQRPQAKTGDNRRVPVLVRRLFSPGALYSPCPGCGRMVECDHSSHFYEMRGHRGEWGEIVCYADGWKGSPFKLPLFACLFACPCGAHWWGEEKLRPLPIGEGEEGPWYP